MRKTAATKTALVLSGAWLFWALACGSGTAWTAAFAFAVSALAVTLTSSTVEESPVAAAFWFSLATYLSTFHWRGGDDIPTALLPLAILKHGTLALDPVMSPFLTGGPDGMQFTLPYGAHRLSFYPVAGAFPAVPLYIITVLFNAPISNLFLHNLAKISGATITAASAAFFCAAAKRRCSTRHALWVTAVYAFGTWAFSVSSQALWIHGPVQLGLALALYGLSGASRTDDLLCGFGLGLAVAARPDSVFIAAAITAYAAFRQPKRLPLIVLGALPWTLELAGYWLHYTGHLRPPDLGAQGAKFGGFSPRAFLAMLVSPTRGLLWFCPAALFGAWAAVKRPASAAPWLAAGALATALFLSCYQNWLAGMTFGQRYLSAAAMVLVFLCVELEPELSSGPTARAWAQAASFSIAVHAVGAYFRWPGSFGLDTAFAQLWDFRLHPLAQLAFASGPLDAWPAPLRWLALAAVLILWQRLAGYFLRAHTSIESRVFK